MEWNKLAAQHSTSPGRRHGPISWPPPRGKELGRNGPSLARPGLRIARHEQSPLYPYAASIQLRTFTYISQTKESHILAEGNGQWMFSCFSAQVVLPSSGGCSNPFLHAKLQLSRVCWSLLVAVLEIVARAAIIPGSNPCFHPMLRSTQWLLCLPDIQRHVRGQRCHNRRGGWRP